MLYEQIVSNKRRTYVLLLAFFSLLALVGYGVGYLWLGEGPFGVGLALVVGAVYAGIMLAQSTNVVMAMNGAREVTAAEAPQLYHVVEDMAMVAQIPMPRVFIIEDAGLNVFATGAKPEKAAVAVTSGLLAVLNREELEAVMGHEVAHIRNYDIRLATLAVALVSAISLLASMSQRLMWYGGGSQRRRNRDREDNGLQVVLLIVSLIALILAPMAASLIQLAISRQREFLADATSVELTRNPQGMINALKKLADSRPMQHKVDEASAALYITDPNKKTSLMEKLFATHPPIAERIARLENMS